MPAIATTTAATSAVAPNAASRTTLLLPAIGIVEPHHPSHCFALRIACSVLLNDDGVANHVEDAVLGVGV